MSNLLFPPFCLHCDERTGRLFCPTCASLFEVVEPRLRCSGCFAPFEQGGTCPPCREKRNWEVPVLAAVEAFGPVYTLLTHLRGGYAPYLAKTAASLMAIQHHRLGWPDPDYLLPTPFPFAFLRGGNPPALLARNLSRLWKVPIAGRRTDLFDKEVLLISDVAYKDHPFHNATFRRYPGKIRLLAFAWEPHELSGCRA